MITTCRRWARRSCALTTFGLAACSALPGAYLSSTQAPLASGAEQWQAPRPGVNTDIPTAKGGDWWQQFDDPLLADLVIAAERASPTLASAKARIEQARASRIVAGAALLPVLNANASAERSQQQSILPLGNMVSASLQTAWELDLFGANRAGRDAAQARFEGSQAALQGVRVAVAAELATNYIALRACEGHVEQRQRDAASRAETERLTALTVHNGFDSPANEALARASAAQAREGVRHQQQSCDLMVKALVAMTELPEPTLRTRLKASTARLPVPASITIPAVPAAALAQRPDVAEATQQVIAASADAAQANAERYPRITLAGNVGVGHFAWGAGSQNGILWSIGPVSVTLPVFDGGTRRANVAAARARYDEAAVLYAATLREAVREVEDALVVLQAVADRLVDAEVSVAGFGTSLQSAEQRYHAGFGTLLELEEVRRSSMQADDTLIELQRERVATWIALYRALGGGWSDRTEAVAADQAPRPPLSIEN